MSFDGYQVPKTKSKVVMTYKKHKMFRTVYPGWLQEQWEDKAAAFFGGLGLGGAEQCGILLTFTSAACIQYLKTGQKASQIPAVLIL